MHKPVPQCGFLPYESVEDQSLGPIILTLAVSKLLFHPPCPARVLLIDLCAGRG